MSSVFRYLQMLMAGQTPEGLGTKAPSLSPANPGNGSTLHAGFSNCERSWEESVDLIGILAGVLRTRGIEHRQQSTWIELPSGLTLQPQVVSFKPLHPIGAQTTSTIQVSHATFPGPGCFEYQHATGKSLEDSYAQGFNAWADLDFPSIADSLRVRPEACMVMEANFDSIPRRVVLGPPAHVVQHPPNTSDSDHPFCPCCLLTQSFKAFKSLFESNAFYAVRLFGMRNASGGLEADCRVNGEDFEDGRQALLRYVETWPDRGFEYRKQLVVFQSKPDDSASAPG